MRSASVLALAVVVVVASGGLVLAQEPPPAATPAPQQAATPPAQPAPAPAPAAAAAPAPAAVAAPAAVSAPEIPVIYMPAIRIRLDGKTQYAGNVKMEFKAQGHDPKVVSVDVIPKMDSGDIAKDLYKQLTLAAGTDYKVKQSGDRVTIERANKKVTTPISLKITNMSVLGVSFMIDKD